MRKLNIGCGPNWKKIYPDYVGLDIIDHSQRYVGDIRFELNHISYEIKNTLWDEVMANHFLEHFTQAELSKIFLDVYSLLKIGGTFKIVVPRKDSDKAYVLTHKTFWTEKTFRALEEDETSSYSLFGKWKIKKLVTNSRKDIHCLLEKI